MPAAINIVGRRYGRLVALRRAPSRGRRTRWVFRCDCGVEANLGLEGVRSGGTRSCGCLRREVEVVAGQTHGLSRTTTYRIWAAMKDRCLNPRNNAYQRYGGRGVMVCEQWVRSFESFYADMGPRPSPKHSIDRINNDGPYSPENCRWATHGEQAVNTRRNVYLSHGGVTRCLSEWARLVGINPGTLRHRVVDLGWTAAEALTVPPGTEYRRGRLNGRHLPVV